MGRNNPSKRRKVIKSLGGLATIGFAGVSTATNGNQGKKKGQKSGSGHISMDLHSGNMKSPEEMAEIAKKATEDTDLSASAVAPGTSGGISTQQEDPNVQNMDPVGGWNGDYTITDDITGTAYADIENVAMLYKSQETDDDGRWHYMMWLWSKGEARTVWTYDWFTNRVNCTTDSVYLSNWAPTRTIDKNNQPVSIGLEIGIGPITIGVNGTTEIKDGSFYTDDITVGQSGRHKIIFDGDDVSTVNAINGVTHFRSRNDYSLYQGSLPRGHFSMRAEGRSD